MSQSSQYGPISSVCRIIWFLPEFFFPGVKSCADMRLVAAISKLNLALPFSIGLFSGLIFLIVAMRATDTKFEKF